MRTKSHWRPAEDAKLKALIEEYGTGNWAKISENLVGRSANSCRQRWSKQLDPTINRTPFTREEEELLLTAHQKYGNKWAFIAHIFDGRTDNQVKNRWYAMRRRMTANSYSTKSCSECSLPQNTNDDPIITEDDTTEFYDFLQVNTNSDDTRFVERGKEKRVAVREAQFIDFLNVGSSSD